MPKCNFTDSTIERLPFEKESRFYSDAHPKSGFNRYSGLRVCVTASSKTFWAQKWDATTGKARQVKLGRFSPSYGVEQAWRDAQSFKDDPDAVAATRAAAKAAVVVAPAGSTLPTLLQATQAFLAYRSVKRRRKPMSEGTQKKYLRCVEALQLAPWRDVAVDRLPTLEIKRMLNDLQGTHPQGAQYVHGVIGAVLRYTSNIHGVALTIPTLSECTPVSNRKDTGKLDPSIDWSLRYQEIAGVENPWSRALWMCRWYMGTHEEATRKLRWSDVNLDLGTINMPDDKGAKARTIAVASQVVDILRTLPRINEWVFASNRMSGRIGEQSRLPLTAPGDLRHFWHEASMSRGTPDAVAAHLTGHSLKSAVGMRGHYGSPDMDVQREWAQKIADYVDRRTAPSVVVELPRTSVVKSA